MGTVRICGDRWCHRWAEGTTHPCGVQGGSLESPRIRTTLPCAQETLSSCSQVAYFIWCYLGEYFGDDCLQAVQIPHCLSECWRIMILGVLCRQFDPFDGKCLFAFDQRIPIIWEIGFLVSWEGSVWGFAFLFSWRFKIVVWLYKWPGCVFLLSLPLLLWGLFRESFPQGFPVV